MFEKLVGHVGHNVEVVTYGPAHGEPENVAVECTDCHTVLADADRPVCEADCPACKDSGETPTRTGIAISRSEELDELASGKDSSALGDEADGGFGDANIEEQDFEGCVMVGVAIAERVLRQGKSQVWAVKGGSATLYFVGRYVEVEGRIRALPAG